MPKEFILSVTFSRNAWQCLVAMASEDLRKPEDFLNWLVHAEARRRGMLNATEAKPPDEIDPSVDGE
jgi:hypothetical protein